YNEGFVLQIRGGGNQVQLKGGSESSLYPVYIRSTSSSSHSLSNSGGNCHSCSFCSYKSVRKHDLERHVMFKHKREKPFACCFCSKRFTVRNNLNIHLRMLLDMEDVFDCNPPSTPSTDSRNLPLRDETLIINTSTVTNFCPLCDYKSDRKGDVRRHMHSRHSEERPFVCQICMKAFTLNAYLKIHMRMHTGVKPYKCQLCSKSFTQKSNLNTHMQTNHPHSLIPMPQSRRGRKSKYDDYGHELLLNPKRAGLKFYSCPMCPYKSYVGNDVKRHIMFKHRGEKPFRCSVCDKCFALKHQLKIHTRIHTGEKPYHCSNCSKQFSQLSHLNHHLAFKRC
ncbi:Zinc finger protein, partial [Armadillidium vulgare]